MSVMTWARDRSEAMTLWDVGLLKVYSALFGILVGSFLFSTIADRIGRRPVMIFATLFFAVTTLLTARAESIGEPA